MFGKIVGLLITISLLITGLLGTCAVFALIDAGGIATLFALVIVNIMLTGLAIFTVVGLILLYLWVTNFSRSSM